MYFRNYRLSKTWLDQSLKSAVLENPPTVNMLKGPRHWRNLHDSTFIIFFHHSGAKWFGKDLSADDKYTVPDYENLQFPIEKQLS